MGRNSAVVLLDVDGVLNPVLKGDALTLEPSRADLVRELDRVAGIVWATTWSSTFTWRLGQDLGLSPDTKAIAFPNPVEANPRLPAPTPKLHWVLRWLSRSFEQGGMPAVIWIDDHLLQDASD
jgi:hypothetical protein